MRSPSDLRQDEKDPTRAPALGREDRLKAALKANMARRKAQAKARHAAEDARGETEGDDC
jgi:hypothetical protein